MIENNLESQAASYVETVLTRISLINSVLDYHSALVAATAGESRTRPG